MLTVRKVETTDRPLLDAAAKADFYHAAAGLTGEHWANGNTLMWSDDKGLAVALKTTQVARIDIQFLTQDKKRNREALQQGFWTFVEILKKRGIEEVIFNTSSQSVINFFQKRFHFRHLGGNEYSLRIGEWNYANSAASDHEQTREKYAKNASENTTASIGSDPISKSAERYGMSVTTRNTQTISADDG